MKRSRRWLLKAGPAMAVGGLAFNRHVTASAPEVTAAADSAFDPWVEVHPANLAHNVDEIRRRVGGRPIMAVIKNYGYGLGVVNVARILEPMSGVAGVAVVKLHEAMALRDAGIRKPVLLLGPFDEKNLADAASQRIMPMVYTPVGPALDRVAARLGRQVPVHVCVDTGIGRVGVPYRAAASFIRELAGHQSVNIQGTMMTFTEDPDFDQEQLKRFQALCAGLTAEGVSVGQKHAASSFGLFQRPDAFLDMVRPGMAIFGVYSEPQFRDTNVLDLRPAVSLKARVIYVKQLHAGESAGYNRAYLAKSDVWVATLPVGHTDGLPRTATKGARVRIGGNLYPLIGSVSASHSIAEIGPACPVQIGDVATFFDWQDGSRPEDVGAACGASVYDLTMHLNPLLPRRVLTTG